MQNDFAMNDTYSRCATVHSFPPSPGRGTRNGVRVRSQPLSSAVFARMASSDASSHTDSGDSTGSGTPSTTTSSSSSNSLVPAAPPPKKFRRRDVPSKLAVKVECIDVDDASLSTPPATLLRESDHYPTNHVDR